MNARNLLFSVTACGGLFTAINSVPGQTWTLTGAPTNGWTAIACSADGTKLVAAGVGIYTSTDSGATWVSNNLPNRLWYCVASSADGAKLLAGTAWDPPNVLFRSIDSGQTWTQLTGTPEVRWVSLACSADGTKLVAASIRDANFGGAVYTSVDSGTTWRSNNLRNIYWNAVASSADGTRLVAASCMEFTVWPVGESPFGPIYTSTNSGATWSFCSNAPVAWRSVACSADGSRLVAGGYPSRGGLVNSVSCSTYTSPDAGATWTAITNVDRDVLAVASSADGRSLVVAGMNVYSSSDSGATWSLANVPGTSYSFGYSVASSADGGKLFAASDEDYGPAGIYTSQSVPTPVLDLAPAGGNLLISWIVPSMNFVLQQKSDLARGEWNDVADTPAFNPATLRYELALSPTNSQSFYHLALH